MAKVRQRLRLELAWPPSVNKYWRHNHGRTHLSSEGREYRDDVWRRCAPWPAFEPDERLSVSLECFPPNNRKRDLDNLPKALLDALEYARLIPDDGQIDELIITREAPRPPNGLVVATLEVIA